MQPTFRGGAICAFLAVCGVGGVCGVGAARAQDNYGVLRINEVISDNETQGPVDAKGNHQDMVEIYNGGDTALSLKGLALSDAPDDTPPNDGRIQEIKNAALVAARGFAVIFLSGNKDMTSDCQTDIDLGLSRDGSEPITLWGPVGTDGKRPVLDQVWLPPLPADVSFGRYPDGAGPAPVPVEETLQSFRFIPRDASTFGACACSAVNAPCTGAPNGPGGNIAPSVNRETHSTNHPGAGEDVHLTVRVEDDKDPTPSDVKTVLIRYSVDGAPQTDVVLEYDALSGVKTGVDEGSPLERWTLWTGSIPGQPAGARVDFTLHVEDAEGLSGTDPLRLCESGIGPCDELGYPGPNCVKEDAPSLKFRECAVPFRYTVGYQAPADLQGLVINEIMANQTKTLADASESPVKYDDYIELHNGSSAPIDLAGLWLSDKPFQPEGWQFPASSTIGPGEYLIVWTDADGARCPDPTVPKDDQPGSWECPDPTDPAKKSYHTNFALETQGDQIYLFDRAAVGLGVIHGHELGLQEADVSLSLMPDGDRNGTFEPTPTGTPGASNNLPVAAIFRRGDSDGSCVANLTDAVYTLRYLFQGGESILCPDAADADDNGVIQITDAIYLLRYLFTGGDGIPAPGEQTPGVDPTDDPLGDCEDTGCQ